MVEFEGYNIHKIVNGDEMAFNRFMEYYSSRLYYYAYGLLGQKEAAEEVVSDVFFEVWKSRKKLAQVESMNAWLQTITYRKSISYLRKEIGKNEISFDELNDFFFEPIQSPDEEIISKEEVAAINSAIQKLPPKCKHVFFLAKIEGLPYIKIAEMLHITVQTVNYHIAYAVETIAKSLNILPYKRNNKKSS